MKSPFQMNTPPEQAAQTPRGAPPCGDGGAAQPLPGLVTLKTSHTLFPHEVEIDRDAARITRLRRSILAGASLLQTILGPKRHRAAMLTLTYRTVDGFSPRHISQLLDRVRNWLSRKGHRFCYVWVGELQDRGALHYHVIVWLPRGLCLPMPDKQGWWPHGSTRIEWAPNSIGYLLKYASKIDSKHGFPKGARMHGAGGFDRAGRQIRSWLNLPSWLKRLAGVETRFVRVKGCGLVERDTGVCVPSPWRVSVYGGRIVAKMAFEYRGGLAETPGPYCSLRPGIAWA